MATRHEKVVFTPKRGWNRRLVPRNHVLSIALCRLVDVFDQASFFMDPARRIRSCCLRSAGSVSWCKKIQIVPLGITACPAFHMATLMLSIMMFRHVSGRLSWHWSCLSWIQCYSAPCHCFSVLYLSFSAFYSSLSSLFSSLFSSLLASLLSLFAFLQTL